MMQAGDGYEVWVVPVIHEKRHLEACLRSRNVQGAITRGLDGSLINVLRDQGIPVVSIRGHKSRSGDEEIDLHVDDEAIGGKAGVEFERLNLDYWGFVHWQGVAWSEARKNSFQAYSNYRGARLSIVSLTEDERYSWDSVLKIQLWLEKIPKPCGVLACNDEAGVDVLHACKLAGLSVPDEVAVIGVDNDRLLCESTVPTLSSIDLHAADVGKAAAGRLLNMLDVDCDLENKAHLGQSSMVVRESSHEIDRYLLVYQKALDYIGSQALAGPSVTKVADSCGVSRRGLERAFEKHSGRSPAEVIREQRLESIIRLLKNQTLNLTNLAEQAGFSDAAGLSNFIKRMTGQAPGMFRQLKKQK